MIRNAYRTQVNGNFPEFIAPMLLCISQYVLIILQPFSQQRSLYLSKVSTSTPYTLPATYLLRQCPNRPWRPHSLLLNWYWGLLPPGCRGRDVKNTRVHTYPLLLIDEIIILLPSFPVMAYTWTLLVLVTLFYNILCHFTYCPPIALKVWGNRQNLGPSDRE